MTDLSAWDNTRVSTFKACPRKFLYSHVYDWQPDVKGLALIFGTAWHAAMDTCWKGYKDLLDVKKRPSVINAAYDSFVAAWVAEGGPHPDNLSPDDLADIAPRTPMVAREMLHGYVEARLHIFSDPSFQLIDVERPFAVPLSPTDPSRFYIGRIDKIFSYRGSVYGGEHKTTTAYRKDGGFRVDFLDSFSPNSQIDGYIFALRMMFGEKAAGIWVDASLVHKTAHDHFKFIPVDRQHSMLDAWLWETQHYIDQIEGNKLALEERRQDNVPYLAAFPKNTASCSNFGGCSYMDLCKTLGNPAQQQGVPLGYKVQHWDPLSHIDISRLDLTGAAKEPTSP